MSLRFRLAACGLLLALALPAWAARPAALRPNLRGEVMILVYHNFGKEARWGRSFANFDRDLARLDAAGYRPITLRQYVTGDFTLPAGTTPVVLTFDDGSKYQVRFTPQGAVAPDCALAHWMAFAKTHPEFPVRGTFFVNPGTDVFAQRAFIQPKLRLLLQLGAEIGNHTYDHPNLRKLTPAQAEREIGLGQYFLSRWLPAYPITSFALPYGVGPNPYGLAAAGTWTGSVGRRPVTVTWRYSAVVLVGSGPAPSPLVAGLNRARLPRIQVFHPEFSHWMNYFARHPQWRFVSDGRPHAAASLPAR
jgi:peptidoglycan/xylan/chitin deacetylase (PgdA/CDA1 family)